jgi:hypothetical protein
MNLEIKHVAPYLPYDLEVLVENYNFLKWKRKVKIEDYVNYFDKRYINSNLKSIKLILRPLSDLNKEVVINGEKHQMWLLINGQKALDNGKIENMNGYQYDILELNYNKIQTILKFHFDIFNLIGQGLAIDINTLSVQNDG